MLTVDELPKKVQYINVDSDFVEGTNNNFSVTFGLKSNVFIEEINRDVTTQFIIDTHSEHLLLRLLRRIRYVEKGQCISEEFKLTNDQASVYYFDPQVSGGTVVTRQLVTPLGDFYTDWPRGFFAERNRDLFDS